MSLFIITIVLNYILLTIFALRITKFKKDSFLWYFFSTVTASLTLYILSSELPTIEYIRAFWIAYLIATVGILSLFVAKPNHPKKITLKASISFTVIVLIMLCINYSDNLLQHNSYTDTIIIFSFFLINQVSFVGLLMLSQRYVLGFLIYGFGFVPTIYFAIDDLLTQSININTVIRLLFSILILVILIRGYFINRKTVNSQ
ncbi:hypothetical protein FLM55_00715 [Francisella sp. Scap27]|uniref:hypothetical protein n=1 Tax=Francisella sp. Scap27 TaxID=2589986 RepID=UPI0015BDAD37|nr:hypothetical protein [Francisella sp. Scap27]QLE78334.1 hypothetical protein FLM55_00715 [Francisella sp. Scap27]